MTTIGKLAEFVSRASFAALAPDDQDRLRRHFLDALFALVVGCHGEEARALARISGATPVDQALVLSAAMRATEVDDIHLPSCTTPASAVVPLVLALAPPGASIGQLFDACAAGAEMMVRLGTAVKGAELLYREIWPTYLGAPLSCAATAARLTGLDATRTAHAMAIALTLTAGGTGRFNAGLSPRWFMHGGAVRAGIEAARAAAAGFCGDITLLDRDWLATTHGAPLDRDVLLDGLGEAFCWGQLSIKPYCSAKQGIAAIEAFRFMLGRGLDPASIRSIAIGAPTAYAAMIDAPYDATNRRSTFVGLRYQFALAAFHPDRLWDVVRTQCPDDPAMRALAACVQISKSDELAAVFPRCWPATLAVETDRGRMETTIFEAAGDPGRPFNDEDVISKARQMFAFLPLKDGGALWVARAQALASSGSGLVEFRTGLLDLLATL